MTELTVRYRLVAFVCEGGVVHHFDEDILISYRDVFMKRPNECRWCVLGVSAGTVLLVDMYDILWQQDQHGGSEPLFHPGSNIDFPTPEAAIAAAMMLGQNKDLPNGSHKQESDPYQPECHPVQSEENGWQEGG